MRRSDRLSKAQQKWWDARADDWVVEVPRGEGRLSIAPDHVLRPAELFGREAPLVVEIGPGMGDSLAPMAAARPDVDVLAFEVYQPAVARILAKLDRAGADNVRIVQADAAEGLARLDREIDELWTFFPDPWHKTKHRKRRLVTTAFADLVATRLRPGGCWRLATDWDDYAKQMHRVLDPHPAFEPLPGGRWEERPLTKFEQRGLDAGRTITDLGYRRR
ncbi:tRNA (guanine-N7-)-methyltransferase [Friedmanniella endophytica]|uniref:tRNA (guanine-N(7)-)-methyltransferase n=1 Tax=Microlunatus kandeliicorticis TaxID=1759536 RepID=A0A7W3IQ28_9ACTN|nr:tRNA (guanosine(46)-N7)-methyltransferase TrmB [Microlunatus kandeliicorticis]MBA8793151.1 tRNA (guanine-N7-)-methyltransferase [Microlunatus kandeliicorticis]